MSQNIFNAFVALYVLAFGWGMWLLGVRKSRAEDASWDAHQRRVLAANEQACKMQLEVWKRQHDYEARKHYSGGGWVQNSLVKSLPATSSDLDTNFVVTVTDSQGIHQGEILVSNALLEANPDGLMQHVIDAANMSFDMQKDLDGKQV